MFGWCITPRATGCRGGTVGGTSASLGGKGGGVKSCSSSVCDLVIIFWDEKPLLDEAKLKLSLGGKGGGISWVCLHTDSLLDNPSGTGGGLRDGAWLSTSTTGSGNENTGFGATMLVAGGFLKSNEEGFSGNWNIDVLLFLYITGGADTKPWSMDKEFRKLVGSLGGGFGGGELIIPVVLLLNEADTDVDPGDESSGVFGAGVDSGVLDDSASIENISIMDLRLLLSCVTERIVRSSLVAVRDVLRFEGIIPGDLKSFSEIDLG